MDSPNYAQHSANDLGKMTQVFSIQSKTARPPTAAMAGGEAAAAGEKTSRMLHERMKKAIATQNDGVKSMQVESLVHAVMSAAIEALKTDAQPVRDAIKLFLDDEKREYKIDDCVRWHLLLRAVRTDQNPNQQVVAAMKALGKLIVEARPYLAFENPYDPEEAKKFYEDQCLLKAVHRDAKQKEIIFNVAAQCGNAEVIAAMLEHGRKLYDLHEPPATHEFKAHYGGPDFLDKPCSLLDLVLEPNPYSSVNKTALWEAAMAEKGSVETVEALLKVEGLATNKTALSCFRDAVENGLDGVIRKYLDYNSKKPVANGASGRGGGDATSLFATSDNIILAIEHIETKMPVKKRSKSKPANLETTRRNIVRDIVGAVKDTATFNAKVVQSIIQRDLMEIWPKTGVSKSLEKSLIHLAVFYQKPDFVEKFVKEYSDLLCERCALSGEGLAATQSEKAKKYALWYNNNRWDEGNGFVPWPRQQKDATLVGTAKDRARIRDLIVAKTIEVVDNMGTLSDIFHDSNEPFGDLCFDISRFNSATYEVSAFVDSLILHSQNRDLLKYEQTLRYVEFPPLDLMAKEREALCENSHFTKSHREVFRILKWLWEKNVRKIIKLKIPDRLLNPHDDEEMAMWVDKFEVEVLDWKVLDLCISGLEEGTKGRIKELHLYSSGSRVVINDWFGEDGVKKFGEHFETLVISVIKETCTEARSDAVTKKLRSHVKKLRDDRPPSFKALRIETVSWYPTSKLVNLGEIANRVAPTLARWLRSLETEVNKKEGLPQYKPTKMAILDNGILSISSQSSGGRGKMQQPSSKEAGKGDGKPGEPGGSEQGEQHQGTEEAAPQQDGGLWARIQDGCSFVDENFRFSPWLFASNPHGTQMANLICAIDPFCQIYVARVAEDSSKITPKRVAKAIKWARSLDVDVISMSFAMGHSDSDLEDELREATKQGIVMTCSAHDEGSRISKAYPADLKSDLLSLLVLAACDEYGKLLRDLSPNKYDYMIRGQNIAAGVIDFLKSEDVITGSSVSTALAAGLCSLILTCDRLAHPGKRYPGGKEAGSRWALVRRHLEKMAADDSKQFLLLEKFENIATPHINQPTAEEIELAASGIGERSAKDVLIKEFGMPA
ncbi:hypothetical protein RB594_000326 [Gaeumannomyces avenae]